MAFGKCESCQMLREMLDRATQGWEGQVAARREDQAEADARYSDLLAKYHALRVGGANPAEERKGLAPAERSLKPADQAIETQMERWGNNPLLRKRLQRYVHEQRIKNVEESDIAHSVLHWSDPDEDAA